MNNTALWMMCISLGIVAIVTIYYFYKAFKTPPKIVDEHDGEIHKPDFT